VLPPLADAGHAGVCLYVERDAFNMSRLNGAWSHYSLEHHGPRSNRPAMPTHSAYQYVYVGYSYMTSQMGCKEGFGVITRLVNH